MFLKLKDTKPLELSINYCEKEKNVIISEWEHFLQSNNNNNNNNKKLLEK